MKRISAILLVLLCLAAPSVTFAQFETAEVLGARFAMRPALLSLEQQSH
jgi:hypothetical protein